MDGRDEFDERDELAVEDLERLGQEDLRDRAAVLDALEVRDRMPLVDRSVDVPDRRTRAVVWKLHTRRVE